MGASGRWAQNVQRDVLRHARRELNVPWELCWVDTVYRDSSSLKTATSCHPLLAPHEVMGLVWRNSSVRCDQLFDVDDLEGFWQNMFRHEPLHLQTHPARSDFFFKVAGNITYLAIFFATMDHVAKTVR